MPHGSHLVTVDLHPRLTHSAGVYNFRLTTSRKGREGATTRKRWRPFSSGCSLPRAALVRRFSTDRCEVTPYYTWLDPFEDAYFISHELMRVDQFDAIFYDGDKVKEAVELNLRAYIPYLRAGGLLIIQDIHYAIDSAHNGMRLFWESLPEGEFEKIGETTPVPGEPVAGIGVAIKR
jgi:hypothetical protein